MFTNDTASDMLREEVAPTGDISKLRSDPIANFGAKILHPANCFGRCCQIYGARKSKAEEIYTHTESLYEILKLRHENRSYKGTVYRRGFIVQCSVNRNRWCRNGYCKYHYYLGKNL